MRKIGVFIVAVLVALSAHAQRVQVIPYEASEPLKLPPDVYFGEVAGIAVNSKHHTFVYTRTGNRGSSVYAGQQSQLFEFGPDGAFIKDIGGNLPSFSWAHSVRIDASDNIWLVDNGSDTVVELGADYRLKLVLGRRTGASVLRFTGYPLPPGGSRKPAVLGLFNQPTDVAVDHDGNIFVSDGYINSNIQEFDRDGNNVKMIGASGSGPLQFNVPHAMAIDRNGRLFVADRQNGRIQVLSNNLEFLREITYQTSMDSQYVAPIPDLGGRDHGPEYIGLKTRADEKSPIWSLWPTAICITPPNASGAQYLYSTDVFPGYIQKFALDGRLVGEVRAGAGRKVGQLGWVHSIACESENEIWVGELLTWRVQKLVLHPERAY